MKNALTIDLEDWYQNIDHDYREWPNYEDRIVAGTARVLDLLRQTDTRATFFVLGYVADAHPSLLARIHDDGHEIASHGYHHEFVYRLTPQQFRSDLVRTTDAIVAATGQQPTGYRAPFFSITHRSWWAFTELAELGFRYDSSIFPVHNHRYGIPDSPRHPYTVSAHNGHTLAELPISTLRLGINWPVGGGVYFRILPLFIIRRAVRLLNRRGYPALLYFHPWEMDPGQPVMSGIHPLFKARRYLNLNKAEARWRALLEEFTFGTVEEVFQQEIAQATPGAGSYISPHLRIT